MINIVIPMAGKGTRFLEAGYPQPKPLIPVHGKPMIEIVINNLRPRQKHKFIFIVLKEHIQHYQIDKILRKQAPNSVIITLDEVSQGAAASVLCAENEIDNFDELIIANSDQWVDFSVDKFIDSAHGLGGLILAAKSNSPEWSYAQTNKNGEVEKVLEKIVISEDATVGIYYYKNGSDFVSAAKQMIKNNDRVNNEFYVAPVYNYIIAENRKIKLFSLGAMGEFAHGLGTPRQLEEFQKKSISKKVLD